MYAIIEACGKQYKVAKGDVVFFEKLDVEENKKHVFDKVVLVCEDGKVQVGDPYVKGIKVEGKVISHGKGKKIIVYKMKPKKGYRRKQGHRQPYTKVEIIEITTPNSKKEESKTSKESAATVKKAEAETSKESIVTAKKSEVAKSAAKETAAKPAEKAVTKVTDKAVEKPATKETTKSATAKATATPTAKKDAKK